MIVFVIIPQQACTSEGSRPLVDEDVVLRLLKRSTVKVLPNHNFKPSDADYIRS